MNGFDVALEVHRHENDLMYAAQVHIPWKSTAAMQQAFQHSRNVYTGHIFMNRTLAETIYNTSADYRMHAPGPMPPRIHSTMDPHPHHNQADAATPAMGIMDGPGNGAIPMHTFGSSDAPGPITPRGHSDGRMGGPHMKAKGVTDAPGPMLSEFPPMHMPHHGDFMSQTATYSYVMPGNIEGGVILSIVLKVHNTSEAVPVPVPDMAPDMRGGEGHMRPGGNDPAAMGSKPDMMPQGMAQVGSPRSDGPNKPGGGSGMP